MTMDETIRSAIMERASREGYAEKMGLKLVSVSSGGAVVEMVPQKNDENIFGMVHGGAIFSLMDEAFQISCNSHGRVAVALNVNVTYHAPAHFNRLLRAESTERHRSKKTATYQITVTDEMGTLIASCQALAYRKKEPLPFLEAPTA
jgi:acyl-CoA thioesterase